MKQLITLAAVGLFALMSTQVANAQGEKAAAKPAAAAPAKAAPAKAATAKAAAMPKWTAAQIKDAQTGLQKAGMYKGKVNGVWNAATIKAYKEWEKANNLPEDGKLSDEALTKLKGAA